MTTFGPVARINNAGALVADYVRDKLRRITRKTDTVGTVTIVYDYVYNLAGRLGTVVRNGPLIADYDYESMATAARRPRTAPIARTKA